MAEGLSELRRRRKDAERDHHLAALKERQGKPTPRNTDATAPSINAAPRDLEASQSKPKSFSSRIGPSEATVERPKSFSERLLSPRSKAEPAKGDRTFGKNRDDEIER